MGSFNRRRAGNPNGTWFVGIRSMPPKGGDPSLSVQDFAGALTYMVNKSSGRWQPPDAVMLTAIDAEITARRAELGKK